MPKPITRRTLMSATALGLAAGAVAPAYAVDDRAPRGSNSVELIIDDSTRKNAVVLDDATSGKNYGPVNVMGNVPRGTNTPTWWRDLLVNPHIYRTDAWWNAIIPWVIVHSVDHNPATNTAIRLSAIRLYLLSKVTNKWVHVQTQQLDGGQFDKDAGKPLGPGNKRPGPGSSIEVKPPQDRRSGLYHGWGKPMAFSRVGLKPWDVKAVHVSVDSKMVVDNTRLADDRKNAKYVIQVGADYYPHEHTHIQGDPGFLTKAGDYWAPGVGNSRNRRINMSWLTHNFTTLHTRPWTGLPTQEPGGSISAGVLRDNPPPLY